MALGGCGCEAPACYRAPLELLHLLRRHEGLDDQVLQLHLPRELTHRVQQVVLLVLLLDLQIVDLRLRRPELVTRKRQARTQDERERQE